MTPHTLPSGVSIYFPNENQSKTLIQTIDWNKSSMGPPDSWPKSLTSFVDMILNLPTPAIIFWGDDLNQIYNDGYSAIMGPRHPRYFGQPYRECWPDTYPTIHPWMQRVLENGEVVSVDRTLIPVTRHGFTEEAYFTFTFSPLKDDYGNIMGILQIVNELTETVLAERRLNTLQSLTSAPTSPGETVINIKKALESYPQGIPFSLIYLFDRSENKLKFSVSSGLDPILEGKVRSAPVPTKISLVFDSLNSISETDAVFEILNCEHTGIWAEPTRFLSILPIRKSPANPLKGVVVLGISPRLRFDEKYKDFFESIVREIDLALSVESELVARLNIEQERERLFSIFEQAPVGICVFEGPTHVCALANAGAMAFFGNKRILLGKSIRTALPEIEGQGYFERMDNVFRSGQTEILSESPVQIKKMDGTLQLYYVNFFFQPIHNANREVEGIVTVVLNVTEQVQTRRKVETIASKLLLAENERVQLLSEVTLERKRLQAVLQQMPEGVIIADPSGNLVLKNAQVEKVLGGIPPANLVNVFALYDGHKNNGEIYRTEDWPLVRSLLKGETIHNEEVPITRLDGKNSTLSMSSAPIRNERDQIIAGVVILHDISHQKNNEQALRQAVRARDEFLSIASHELKTPLTPLKLQLQGFLKNLKKGSLPSWPLERIQKTVESSEKQITRLTNLIEDLLDVSRINAGKLTLNLEELDVSKVIQDVIDRFVPQAEQAACRLVENLESSVFGYFDLLRVEQIVTNLLSNAIKYAPGKPIRITLKQKNNAIEIKVQDFGNGIAEKDLSRIFSRFERISSETNVGGLGLGLFITKQIVLAHGGKIWAASQLGQRTTFTVELPLKRI